MLNQSQVEEFHAKGFLLGWLVLRAEEVEVLREEFARVIENQGRTIPQPVRIINLSRDPDASVWQVLKILVGESSFSPVGL